MLSIRAARSQITAKVVVCASVLTLLLLAGPMASTSSAMTKALQDTGMLLSDNDSTRAQFWRSVKATKTLRVRLTVDWYGGDDHVAADHAADIRRAVAEAQENKVAIYLTIFGRVAERLEKDGTQQAIDDLITRFSGFTKSLAETVKDYPIAAFATWNEPNFNVMWPKKRILEWKRASNAAYNSFKSVLPDVPVLVGETAPFSRNNRATEPGQFMRKVLCLGKNWKPASNTARCREPLLADGFALHTYDYQVAPWEKRKNRDSWTVGNLRTAMAQLRRMGKSGRFSAAASRNVHITEFAYLTRGKFAMPSRKASSYLKWAWKDAKGAGIKSFTWYGLRDPKNTRDWSSGLENVKGSRRMTWKTFRSLK